MQIVADLQLHSKYSRAVSQKMDLTEIDSWAAKKGIGLTATGDWTHPLWFREITTNLTETSPGIFALKSRLASKQHSSFLLSTEISSIYSQGGKVRRVHNLLFSPSLSTCQKIIKALEREGAHLMSDGRPVVGISSRDLLEMVYTIDEDVLFIPAHVWTPWFSLYGSKSGFDSIEECFGTLSSHIYAIETGLSSDPTMNWQIKELTGRSILSFSDAHSGPKLGREATVFVAKESGDISYEDVARAIGREEGKLSIGYTIEFFPEEGKYHWSGHRNCSVRYSPKDVKEKGILCPVCKRPLTIGVENRVIELAERIYSKDDLLFEKNSVGLTFVSDREKKRRPFVSMVPLVEILLEIHHSQTRALFEYEKLVAQTSEFEILLHLPYEEIEKLGGAKLRAGIQAVRERKVTVDPGYDGVFGKVNLLPMSQGHEDHAVNQESLF